ncbi:EAL domain-containing protein [Herbaspirillum sp.]|jgi:diguanylate cyclase (GGDEF)-like protein/PAS domain S-box-containing protein|uniref:EAL domain-containing protein n=2 Tax=Oxalobacteraceae TaxID=75682 RepID=UPI002590403A|nr:EAL domain-containing protein [Herbaspirillum sp.]
MNQPAPTLAATGEKPASGRQGKPPGGNAWRLPRSWPCLLKRLALLGLLAAGSVCMTAHAQPPGAPAKLLTVGVYQNPPKIFFDGEGTASGLHIDLIRLVAEREHWQLRFAPCEWQACLKQLEEGRIDLLPDVAWTEQREKVFQFPSVPALYSWSILYRSRSVAINSVFDLKDKRIGLLENSVQASYFRNLIDNSGIKVHLVTLHNVESGFRMAAAGELDGVVASQQAGDMLADRYHLADTSIVFQPVKLFFVSGKQEDPEVLAAIDRALSQWQADPDSIYFQILRKWGRGNTSLPAHIWWLLCGALALLLCALLIAAYLRREVARRTARLQQSETSLRIAAAAFHSSEAIWVLDAGRNVLDANAAFIALTGYQLHELPAEGMPPCQREQDQEDFRARLWTLVQRNGKWQGEVRVWRKNGETFCAMLTLTAVADPAGHITHYVGTQIDISDQKRLQDETRQLALYDPLTGLPNRRLLLDQIAAASYLGQPSALFFIDIDNFKDLNDALGHSIGDRLLCRIATRLQELAGGALVARLGGDEFVILQQQPLASPALIEESACGFAQRIVAAMEQRFDLDGLSHFATCSVGIALMHGQGASVEDLLRQGDLAMYAAKQKGRNTSCLFDQEMEHALHFRTGLESDLRRAIGSSEFLLHYQPQRDQAGNLIGVEALARWNSPFRGSVSPAIFIPVAEASGLILPLGLWVFQQACRQSVRWNREGRRVPVVIAVNVSAVQVRQPDFVKSILETLQATGADPCHLKLELTESAMVEDVQATIEKMMELKQHGLALSLDDFGTGYSSLSLLKRLPIDQLKIDQSFVRELLFAPSDVAIAKSIITLADALGLEVIAEGVETREQQQFLAALGCTRYQGYLFGRPVPAEQFDDVM